MEMSIDEKYLKGYMHGMKSVGATTEIYGCGASSHATWM